jgi:hypothetical protein
MDSRSSPTSAEIHAFVQKHWDANGKRIRLPNEKDILILDYLDLLMSPNKRK